MIEFAPYFFKTKNFMFEKKYLENSLILLSDY